MKRKEFLKGIIGTAALCYVSRSLIFASDNKFAEGKRVHFVGLGGAGRNSLEYIHGKKVKADYTSIGDFSCSSHESIQQVTFCKDFKHHFEAENMPSINEGSNLISTSFLEHSQTIILLAGLGGFTGTVLGVYLMKKLKAYGKNVYLFATTPFNYEGNSRQKYLAFALKELEHEKNVFLISNEVRRKEFGNLPLEIFFEKTDEMFLNMAREIIG